MNKPEIIAEIGWNHQGDMTLAKKMIKAASLRAQIMQNSTWSVKRLKKVNGIMMAEEIYKVELTKKTILS